MLILLLCLLLNLVSFLFAALLQLALNALHIPYIPTDNAT